jgi:Zn-dependent M28 family amino/carboxypeptidase
VVASLKAAIFLVIPLTAAGQSAGDPAIRKLVGEISQDRIGANIKTLAAFGTRGNYSHGIGAARGWIVDQFHSYSPRLEVSFDTAKKGAADIVSVITVLRGADQPEKRILITAHYDSINLRAGDKAPDAKAPGADDDASGTAVVLELARVMSQYRFRKTIVFIAFAGEEVGMIGSTHYAAHARVAGEQVEAVFNNDIVGSNMVGVTHDSIYGSDDDAGDSDGDTGNRMRIYSPDPATSASRRLARTVQDAAARYVPSMNIDLVTRADRFDRGGDQVPFQTNGFAAVRFTSASENTAVQHTDKDVPEAVSPAFTAGVARVNAAAAATLALPAGTK